MKWKLLSIWLLGLVFVSIAIASIWDYNPSGSDPSLIGYWKLDGNALDETGKNNGTVTGAVVTNKGKYGQAYEFDGVSSLVNIGDFDDAEGINEVTVSMWVKRFSAPSSSYQYIIYKSGVYSFRQGASLEAALYNSTGGATATCTGATWLDVNEWHHWGISYDGSIIRSYIDGSECGNKSLMGPLQSNSNSFYIGGYGGSQEMNGIIDEVRIYNRTLSADEIRELYNESLVSHSLVLKGSGDMTEIDTEGEHTTINNTDMVGVWQFEGNALDSTTNGNNGTVTGATNTSGMIGGAYEFDGTGDYVLLPDLVDSYPFTMTVWFSINDISADGTVFSLNDASNYQIYYMLSHRADDLDYTCRNETVIASARIYTVLGENKWHFATIVFKNDTYREAYLDGVWKQANTVDCGFYSGVDQATIGLTRTSTPVGYFNGTIDEVMIYNRTLSADEISALYNEQKDKLVGHWDLNGNTDDSSKYNNDGTVTNALVTNKGKFKQAYEFDGAGDYVSMGDIDGTDGLSEITVSVWVKSNVLNQNGIIVGKNDVNNVWTLLLESGTLKWRGGGADNTVTSSSPAVDVWTHIVATQSGTAGKLYVSGTEVDTGVSTALGSSALAVEIGRYSTAGGGYYFNGTIDEVRIYSKALTAAEVRSLYNESLDSHKIVLKGSPTQSLLNDPSLVSKWSLDGNANDYKGINNGTVTGAVVTNKGKFSGAYEFDGAGDYITVSDDVSLRFDGATEDFTVSLWIKRKTIGTQYLLDKRDADNDGWRVIFGGDNKLYTSIDNVDVPTSTVITDTNWHNYVFVADRSGNGQPYLDGVVDGSAVAISGEGAMETTTDVFIGTTTSAIAFGNYFNGTIDEVLIFNRSLSAEEISSLYNQSLSSNKFIIKGSPDAI